MGRDCKMKILIMSIHGNVNAPTFWCHIMEPSTKNILVGYVIMMQFYQSTLIICFQDVLDCVQNVSKDSVIQEQLLLLSTEIDVDLPCYTDRELLWYTAVDHRSSHATLFPVKCTIHLRQDHLSNKASFAIPSFNRRRSNKNS